MNRSNEPNRTRCSRRTWLAGLLAASCFPAAALLASGRPVHATVTEATTASPRPPRPSQTIGRPAGWAAESHGDEAAPNYAVVFPQDTVSQLRITIAPEYWAAMQTNLTELFGPPGQGGGPGGGRRPALPADPAAAPEGLPAGGPGGQPGGRATDMTPVNPIWVPGTIEFNGQTWTNVGVRYKGNSSLTGTWRNGSQKLGLKLDFDEFEDRFPAIKNQRFYGFKQLSLGNNWGDSSYLRETLTYDLLADAGLVAAETALYEVVVDSGEGPVSLGVYTAVEVIDDTVIRRAFGDDRGNIYEADGRAASLAQGTQDQIADSFVKENNKSAADWSDIQALYDLLHAPERTTDPAAWRTNLEARFDVDSFLEWLAISAAIQHWDTYGGMNHNYYLYNDPSSGKLNWISWDHNLVLGAGPGGPAGGAGPAGAAPTGGARPPAPGGAPTGAEGPPVEEFLAARG